MQSICNEIIILKTKEDKNKYFEKWIPYKNIYTFNIVNDTSEKVFEAHLISDKNYIIFHFSKSNTEVKKCWTGYLKRHIISFSLGCLDFRIKTETNNVFNKFKKKTPNYTCCPMFP